MRSVSCISTRAASSNRSWPRERFRPGAEKPVPPQIARRLDDRVDPGRVHDLRRARRILSRLHIGRGPRCRRSPDHGQQDQLHPADADRLFQPRAGIGGGAAGHLMPTGSAAIIRTRRISWWRWRSSRPAISTSTAEFEIPPEQLRPSSATAAAPWSASDGANGAGKSAIACRRSNIFSQKSGGYTWDFTIAGIVNGKTEQVDTISCCSSMLFRRDARSARTPSAG